MKETNERETVANYRALITTLKNERQEANRKIVNNLFTLGYRESAIAEITCLPESTVRSLIIFNDPDCMRKISKGARG